MDRIARDGVILDDRLAFLSPADLLAGLTADGVQAIVEAAPMRTFAVGELLYTPHRPVEALFLLKRGRVRIFRVRPDGRALTTAVVPATTMFGEMVPLGQHMYDNYAEAVDEALVCVLNRTDVQTHLLSDPRVAARIVEILGQRLVEMQRRLSDAVFKTVPQRVAAILCGLGTGRRPRGPNPPGVGSYRITVTPGQVAALAGTSREAATRVLGSLAEHGMIRLGRGTITVLDPVRLAAEAGDT
jgi:CRP-like cAMP-binding protein